MKKQSILAVALSLTLFSCQKEKEQVASPVTSQEASAVVAENFVNAKYAFFESEQAKADFDALFTSVETANSLEKEMETEKSNMNLMGIKYVSHTTDFKIKSRTKNSDASETLLLEELSVIKTNQISESTHEVISTTMLQQYNMTLKFIDGHFIISELIDLDKEALEHQKTEAENYSMSKVEKDEILNMTQDLSGITGTYNRNNVYVYATTYAINPNPAYQDFSPGLCSYCGGDCTNFLAQCFLAGGWIQKFGASSSLSTWWYGKSTNPSGYRSGFSGTWVSAYKMGFFLKNLTSRVTRVTSLTPLQLSDAVQLVSGKNGNAYHSLIVTQKSTMGNLFLSCHTSNRYNAPITTWGLTSTTNYSGILPTAFLWQVKNTF